METFLVSLEVWFFFDLKIELCAKCSAAAGKVGLTYGWQLCVPISPARLHQAPGWSRSGTSRPGGPHADIKHILQHCVPPQAAQAHLLNNPAQQLQRICAGESLARQLRRLRAQMREQTAN